MLAQLRYLKITRELSYSKYCAPAQSAHSKRLQFIHSRKIMTSWIQLNPTLTCSNLRGGEACLGWNVGELRVNTEKLAQD